MSGATGHHGGWFNLLDALHADQVTAQIWDERATVQTWLDVESALAQSHADAGVVERVDADQISAACTIENIDLDRLWEQTRNVGYPILPLVRMIADKLPTGP